MKETTTRDYSKVGGWLLVMCILMMYVGPVLGLINTAAGMLALERRNFGVNTGFEGFKVAIWFAKVVLWGASFWAGWQLKNKLIPETVAHVKRLIWLIFVGGSILLNLLIPTVFLGVDSDTIARGLMFCVLSTAIAGMYVLYLSKSERVRMTYRFDASQVILEPGISSPSNVVTEQSPKIERQRMQSTPQPAMKPSDTQTVVQKEFTREIASPSVFLDQPNVVEENGIYSLIAHELETNAVDKGLWTRLFAECDGDEQRIKVLYIKQRAERLFSVAKTKLEQAAAEQAAHAEESERIRRERETIADPRMVAAVWNGNWTTAIKLLGDGVKPMGVDEDGNSLLDLAKIRGDLQMIKLLQSHMSRG